MRAVICDGAGDVDVLRWTEVPDPTPSHGEVVVDVAASAVNRADLLQRQGFYPPPPGVTDIAGLECSGRISEIGSGVAHLAVGDVVCCLLAGGGQAERVAVPAGQCMPIPDGVDPVTAGGLPEVACTVWSNLVDIAALDAGEVLLVHGGSSGVGTMAIQVAKALGATVAVTAGTIEKLNRCRELGADIAVNYREDDFVEAIRNATGGHGADVILDIVGAKYLSRNVDLLATNGRLVVIGLQGGTTADINLGDLLRRRGAVHATSLRSRPLAEKAQLCAAVVDQLWPLITAGKVRPVIATTYAMDRIADAHRLLAASTHVGKVLLTTGISP